MIVPVAAHLAIGADVADAGEPVEIERRARIELARPGVRLRLR